MKTSTPTVAQWGVLHYAARTHQPTFSSLHTRSDVIRRCRENGWLGSDYRITATGYAAWAALLPKYCADVLGRARDITQSINAAHGYAIDHARLPSPGSDLTTALDISVNAMWQVSAQYTQLRDIAENDLLPDPVRQAAGISWRELCKTTYGVPCPCITCKTVFRLEATAGQIAGWVDPPRGLCGRCAELSDPDA